MRHANPRKGASGLGLDPFSLREYLSSAFGFAPPSKGSATLHSWLTKSAATPLTQNEQIPSLHLEVRIGNGL